MNGCFGSFYDRAGEWVVGLLEDERKRHFVAVDTYVIFDHIVFYEVLAITRVSHLCERVEY